MAQRQFSRWKLVLLARMASPEMTQSIDMATGKTPRVLVLENRQKQTHKEESMILRRQC